MGFGLSRKMGESQRTVLNLFFSLMEGVVYFTQGSITDA
jgi:hypothetical protein